ncbi:MAG TPA: malonate decarboxylase subunit epsilon [Puia sp.]|nr:malonate decarboxylase subunit epsilon [Puia sp.]
MKTVFLFPGQGSQKPGMLDGFPSSSFYKDAKEILGQNLQSLDSEENLRSTVYAQICLLIAGVISARKLQTKGVHPDFVAGHSVGAFAAAVISEVISFKQALSIIRTRATLMEQAYPRGYGMAVLVGMTEAALQKTLTVFNRDHDTVYLSNINSPDQLVVSGKLSSLEGLIQQLQQRGIRKAQVLDVAVPSHCPLLNGVSETLKARINQMELHEPVIPYASNHNGRLLRTKDAIGMDLCKSIAAPVRWYEATTLLYELGARLFIEMEPSGVLSKIAGCTFPEAKVLSFEANDTDTITWLWKIYQQENQLS